ncbi:MAG: pseudouridine synthase [Pseudomonadota bacterium]
MTERRETGRRRKASKPHGKSPRKPKPDVTLGPSDWSEGERIAKYLARAGVASRRECETLIAEGKVSVNGERLVSPAFKVTGTETIRVGRKIIAAPEPARLWRYHKPSGLITTTVDPEGRPTIFGALPKSLPRVVTVGRLDLTTEGLLLLTNDGELARGLELPKNAFTRTYRTRAHGKVTQDKLDVLKQGVTVDGTDYAPIDAVLERQTGANSWLTVSLSEGKKREVRRALESVELEVNRLIRTQYGPFALGELPPGAVEEVPARELMDTVGALIPEANRPGIAPERKNRTTSAAGSRLGRPRRSANVRGKAKHKP